MYNHFLGNKMLRLERSNWTLYKPDGTTVCVEDKGVNLHTKSCHILLLKLTSQMALGRTWQNAR